MRNYPKRQKTRKMQDEAERFWRRVDKTDGCWLWTGSISDGYGHFGVGCIAAVNKAILRTHRWSWEHANGLIPEGMHVLHRCDVRACVRPSHLFLGSNSDNVSDRVAKGRGSVLRGENAGRSKLTQGQVDQMRVMYSAGGVTQKKLGEQFGICGSAVGYIIRCEHYA